MVDVTSGVGGISGGWADVTKTREGTSIWSIRKCDCIMFVLEPKDMRRVGRRISTKISIKKQKKISFFKRKFSFALWG